VAICRPADGAAVPAGTIRIQGYALGTGGPPVDPVELSRDGGRTWRTAVVRDGGSRGTWLLWHLDVDLPPGSVEIAVRATDASGTRQPEHVALTGNPRRYANNGWQRIRVVAVPQAGE
jgi:sulfite oxidase